MKKIARVLQTKLFYLICAFFSLSLGSPVSLAISEKDQINILAGIENDSKKYGDLALKIWDLAELGYLEEKSSSLLSDLLKENSFSIKKGIAGIPTAFKATRGKGGPVIAILGEFDALPGISQAALPFREETPGKNAAHACGHHLFGTASAQAAIAVAEWLEASGTPGRVIFYGTPAEEGGSGKVYLTREKQFDDVDIVLHWHPSSLNSASPRSTNANKSGKFRFKGIASHAAGSPELGRSALDGVEAMNYMVNLMREHVPEKSRMHYVITSGGEAPNVVPDFAEVYYYIRHPNESVTRSLFERVVKAAEAAALGTETEMTYEVIHGNYSVLPNTVLSKMVYDNLLKIGGISYTKKENKFAMQIEKTLDPSRQGLIGRQELIEEFKETSSRGSTDVGDISWNVPTAGFSTATWVPGTSSHSWQAVAAGGTSLGTKGLNQAAKLLTLSAIKLFENPDIIREAWEELEERRGKDFAYYPLLGDRKPPLDYRKAPAH